MSKFKKLTVEQIRALLQRMNPKRFGANADPIVLQEMSLILTCIKIANGAGGEKIEQYVDRTTVSEEAQKANPGLTSTRYVRILKTDNVKDVDELKPGEVLHTGRRPLADNLFERQQPIVFENIIRMLRAKDKDGNYIYFTKMEPDTNGNPRLKLKNPLLGAFVTLNVPGHMRVDQKGNILKGARKDILTGKFGDRLPQVFRSITLCLFEHDIDRMEEIAISTFERTVEPALLTEVTLKLSEGGTTLKEEISSNPSAEETEEITEGAEHKASPKLDADGIPM